LHLLPDHNFDCQSDSFRNAQFYNHAISHVFDDAFAEQLIFRVVQRLLVGFDVNSLGECKWDAESQLEWLPA